MHKQVTWLLVHPSAFRRMSMCMAAALLLLDVQGQTISERASVQLSAVVDAGAPSITVQWAPFTGSSAYTIYRRPSDSTLTWTTLASLGGAATQWTDHDVLVGAAYDYKIVRTASGAGYGYIRSGIAVPPVEDRGSVVLLVDATLAVQLNNALTQLQDDLLADGWWVHTHLVGASATPPMVRALVAADRLADPDVALVYILGHVPVAYSGNIDPDGHPGHTGAWPCDPYYGDLDGTWTDVSVNNVNGTYTRNHNVPGDGKFDQSDIPSSLELGVGRVDLHALPSFGMSEVQLTQAYLAKAHAWRTKAYTVPATAALFDDLQSVGYPLAGSGLMGLSACVGPGALTILPINAGPFVDHFTATTDLWTFQCAGGAQGVGSQGQVTFTGTTNGVLTAQIAQQSAGGVFNMSFGSYFGDWDNEDNYLRALLGSGNSLVHFWSGVPNWYVYPMAMGATAGACMLRSVNNTQQDQAPQNGGWQGQNMGRVHMALMGDPTLRQACIAPPSMLTATNTDWFASFTWSPSAEPVDGYLIHRIDTVAGSFERITPEVVTDTFFVSTEPFMPGARYLVRAVKLLTSNTGSYRELSPGALAVAQGMQVPDCEGVLGGPAIPGAPCDDGDPLTVDDAYDLQCSCTGVPANGIAADGTGTSIAWRATQDALVVRSDRAHAWNWHILTTDGRCVGTGAFTGTTERITLQGLPSGAYLFRLDPAGDRGKPRLFRFVHVRG
ncbi:MAG: hypothetical protein H6594_11390 [Flavobacteriales bacterium]|nr:hypothetical protein [Flavobacteriales bacterium]